MRAFHKVSEPAEFGRRKKEIFLHYFYLIDLRQMAQKVDSIESSRRLMYWIQDSLNLIYKEMLVSVTTGIWKKC
ncbi:hypothetical protein CEXT_9381 [Caerostris extrusa]|uniref:Uncharacterized protein n=1 Tax=Caerostris extrusa TaxID=172846 RepID=A0AAV4NRA3_CAEEX|nr:hypothetical protein CEXT_9381 [Caerostris extrusa]